MCDAVVVATDGVAGEGVGSAEAVVEGELAIVFSAVWETARYVILFLCLCLCLSCSFFLSLCLSVCVSVCACVLCLCIYQR
jgi:hypothetical protein